MLNFAPSKADASKGIYTIEENWADFFTTEPATDYFVVTTVADKTTVVLKDGVTEVDQTIAKAAIAYAKNNGIAAKETKKANDSTVEFTGLEFGYYAIDSSLGILCSLTNTNRDFTAIEKNEKPDIDKYVQEDSEIGQADEGWGKVNDADIDQVVNFKSTITIGEGVTNYIMHDTMDTGLTFNNDVVVKLDNGSVVDGANYTVIASPADNHTFDIEFDNDYIKTLAKGTMLTVYYSAKLNEMAKIVDDGNDNTVYLSYGEDSTRETSKHTTTTYTWKMDVLKFTKDGENKTPLAGAEFQLLDKDNKAIKFSQVAGAAVPTYMVDTEGTVTNIITDANGKFEFVGLDEGVYALHEVEAPEGYNKLTTDKVVTITSNRKDAELTAEYKIDGATPATIEVENKTGGVFPETGGIGTAIFYGVGALLMLIAAVILISKKRMASFS